MKQIEHEGKLYRVLEWQKPEDTDYGYGECVYAIYPMAVCPYPIMVMAIDDKKFRSIHYQFPNDIQPLLVLCIPALDEKALVQLPGYYSLVGDARNETD